nr:MAG TPA: Cysteine-rich domain protein [Caudoviricetes sp.]
MMNCNCNASIVILYRAIDDHGHGNYICVCPHCALQVLISR